MANIRAVDWNRIRALCARAGISPERVDRLEKNYSGAPITGVTLLAGTSKTLALFLARWLGSNAAAALSAAGGAPLVIGQNPDAIQPAVGIWPGLVSYELEQRHIVAIESSGAIAATLRSAIASLGTVDQAAIISRLGQPLPADERQLIKSMATIAATARVVFMGMPSEEGTPDERTELAAYGIAQLEAHGFQGRCLGAGVWYADGVRPADTIQNVVEWLAVRADDVVAGRVAAGEAELSALLAEAEVSPDRPSDAELSIEEADDLGRKFNHHVTELGRRLKELADAGEFPNTAACRSFFVESLHGWRSRASLEGMLLDYVENARPGIKAELREQAAEASEYLSYEPTFVSPSGRPLVTSGMTKQFCAAALAAIMAFLQSWFVMLLSNLGSVVAALCAFAAAKESSVVSPKTMPRDGLKSSSAILGWASAELRLTNWFNNRIRSLAPSVRQECAAIRSQLCLEPRR